MLRAFVARFAKAEAQAVTVALDADNLQRQEVAFAHDFLRVGDAAVDEFRDMDQAFDGALDARKRAEGDELGDHAGHDAPDLVLVDDEVPLFGLRAPQAEGDLLRFGVDLHDVHVDFVADLEHLFGRLVAIPRDFAEVREAVGATEVDEDTEAADAGDAALADLALFELGEQAVLLLRAPLLQRRALGEDDAVAAAVDLDDLEPELLADGGRETALAVLFGANADDL